MSNKLFNTLFIIGAGAHVPYNMPTGAQLRNKIKELYKCPMPPALESYHNDSDTMLHKKRLFRLAHDLEIVVPQKNGKPIFDRTPINTIAEFHEFFKSFCESHVLSIDTYLSNLAKEPNSERRKSFGELGKLTIAYLISQAELATSLGERDDDWIHFFINQYIKPDYKLFFHRAPKILTFNYDRLFERMIFTHLTEYHKLSKAESKNLVDGLDIFHVYGKLGDYSMWNDELSNEKTQLGFYRQAMDSIIVIGEERDRNVSFETQQKIKRFYEQVDQIYFMGYGYDELNNQLLTNSFGYYQWYDLRKSHSTAIGINNFELKRIEKSMRTRSMFHTNRSGLIEHDCMSLLTDGAPLEL